MRIANACTINKIVFRKQFGPYVNGSELRTRHEGFVTIFIIVYKYIIVRDVRRENMLYNVQCTSTLS